MSEYKYILAYGIVLVLWMLLIRTKIGYKTAYYVLSLCLFLFIVTESKFIVTSLAPILPNIERTSGQGKLT